MHHHVWLLHTSQDMDSTYVPTRILTGPSIQGQCIPPKHLILINSVCRINSLHVCSQQDPHLQQHPLGLYEGIFTP